jgi:hypothetical protein
LIAVSIRSARSDSLRQRSVERFYQTDGWVSIEAMMHASLAAIARSARGWR